jgi:hypothetical protein
MLGEVELVNLDLPMGTANLTCWALPEARGRGMGSAAVGAVVRFGSVASGCTGSGTSGRWATTRPAGWPSGAGSSSRAASGRRGSSRAAGPM